DDIPRLGKAFLLTVSLTALVTVPVFFAMAVVPEIVIGGLFGGQWKPAAATFQILCLSGPFMAMMRVFGAVTNARAYLFSECRRQVIYLLFVAAALWLFFSFGLEGFALAVALAAVARYFLLAQLALELAGIKWRRFFAAQIPGVALGAAVALPVYVASGAATMVIKSDVLILVVVVVVSVVYVFLKSLLFLTSWFGDLFPWLVDRFGPKLPHWLRELLAAKLPGTRYDVVNKNVEAEI